VVPRFAYGISSLLSFNGERIGDMFF